jgi:hypothetical protein
MRFNFKKIASVLASAAMLGSTVGMAAAASYPDPFVKGGVANVAIVLGASSAPIDTIASIDLSASLQEELAKQTATTTVIGASTDQGINLASSSQKLYFNSTLNSARTTLSKSDLPVLLADGKVTDDAGTDYSYSQTITPGNTTISFGNSGDLDDPVLLIQAGTEANSYLYQVDVTFNKNINITSSDVQGNTIKILGRDFTIGAGSSSNTPVLYLYGAGTEKTLKEGETANVEVNSKTYTLEVKSVEQISGINYASLSIDGGSTRRIQEGTSSKVGDLEIYAKAVHYLAKEAQVSYVDFNIGSTKLKIGTSGTTVKQGADDTSIQGTRAILTSTGANGLSKITLKVAAQKAATDHIAVGSKFVDPIFGGLELQFADVAPTLDSELRDSVVIDTDNNRNAKVTFTSALAGETGEKTVYFGRDMDTSDSSILVNVSDSSGKTMHVVEGEMIGEGEIAVINAGGNGRIVKANDIPTGELETTSEIFLEDVITGDQVLSDGLTVGTDGNATATIDGNPYYFSVKNGTSASSLVITWGTGASEGLVGTQTTVYPTIKLAKGGKLAFLASKALTSASTYSLPGIDTLADYETGAAAPYYNVSTSKKFGNVNYTFASTTNTSASITGIDVNEDGLLQSGTDCLFNSTADNGVAILFIEEKKTTESGNANNGDFICVNVDKSGTTTPTEVSVSTPLMSGISSGLQTLTTDSNVRQAITRYGTFVQYDSADNDKVTIAYPDEQMYADVLLVVEGAEVTAGSSGGSVASLGSVAILDSELATASAKNLLVIGGGCINTVAAKILGSTSPICGADFTAKTNISAGQFLIKVVDAAEAGGTAGKVAMLVSGYEGADTRKAVTLINNKPTTAR